MNGVAQAYGYVAETGVKNVRIWPDDVRLLLPSLPHGCLQRIYLLFPDPWPKKRHTKRRMLQPNVLAQFARVLAKGGQLLVATDHDNLGVWMHERLELTPHFNDVRQTHVPPDFWVTTRYQQKAIDAGRKSVFISAVTP
jgi:tRNA (guanine-N7-)-methyltransferase